MGIVGAALLLVFSTALPGLSQVYMYSGDDNKADPQKIIIDLNSDDQDLADEYIEIIEQLREIIEDYTDYLYDIDEDNPCDNQINFNIFEKALASGQYAEDIGSLKKDIEYYIDDLNEIQKNYKSSKDSEGRHCYRISRSLNRELSILNNLIDQNISSRIVQKLNNKQFQLYLQESILKFAEQFEDGLDLTLLEEQMESLGKKFEDLDIDVLDIPTFPSVTIPPETPDIPEFEHPKVQTRVYINDRQKGESGLAKVYNGYLSVSSSKEPIYITNPVGGISIRGTSNSDIEAQLNIEVSADSRIREKKFVSSSGLKVEHYNKTYHVTVELPQLTDPQTKILNSQLIVTLPSNNLVICDNSFGRVDISELDNGMTLKGQLLRDFYRRYKGSGGYHKFHERN